MLWWNYQSKLKKILYAGSFLSLAVGLTTQKIAIIIGVFSFIVLFLIAAFLPPKKDSVDKDWYYTITPHFYNKGKKLNIILNIIAVILFTVAFYYLFDSLFYNNYILSIIIGMILSILFFLWLDLNPKYYNEIYVTKKIVPDRNNLTTRALYDLISTVSTPFGEPLLGFVPNFKEEVGVYRIIDIGWIVYFYTKDDFITIEAIALTKEALRSKEANWILLFTQQVADLISFVMNTTEVPDKEIAAKIFKLPYKEY